MFAPGQFLAGLSMPLALLAFSLTTAADELADVIDPIRKAENSADDVPDVTSQLVKEVNRIRPQPFLCEFTGAQPRQAVTEEADESQTICSCDPCQRWAFDALRTIYFPFKYQEAPQALKRVERVFLGLSFDEFANEQDRKQKAKELGVLNEWLEHRHGRSAIWPDRCALTRIPSEKSFFPAYKSGTLCSCDNCQQWAFRTLNTLGRDVVDPLADGRRDQALAALAGIIQETRDLGRDLRANTVQPQWLREIYRDNQSEYRCELTSDHPERPVLNDAAQTSTTLCQCDSCQRWALRSLQGLTTAVRMVKRQEQDQAMRMLNSTIGMLDNDHGGMEDRRMAKARELGVMDEWVEYTYGKRALWPDRCVITNLPSDKALTPTAMPLCKCEACQNWAATTIRDLHTQVVNPLRNRDRDKALAAIQEIIAAE